MIFFFVCRFTAGGDAAMFAFSNADKGQLFSRGNRMLKIGGQPAALLMLFNGKVVLFCKMSRANDGNLSIMTSPHYILNTPETQQKLYGFFKLAADTSDRMTNFINSLPQPYNDYLIRSVLGHGSSTVVYELSSKRNNNNNNNNNDDDDNAEDQSKDYNTVAVNITSSKDASRMLRNAVNVLYKLNGNA